MGFADHREMADTLLFAQLTPAELERLSTPRDREGSVEWPLYGPPRRTEIDVGESVIDKLEGLHQLSPIVLEALAGSRIIALEPAGKRGLARVFWCLAAEEVTADVDAAIEQSLPSSIAAQAWREREPLHYYLPSSPRIAAPLPDEHVLPVVQLLPAGFDVIARRMREAVLDLLELVHYQATDSDRGGLPLTQGERDVRRGRAASFEDPRAERVAIDPLATAAGASRAQLWS